MENSLGLMAGYIKVIGKMENNMVAGYIEAATELKEKENGEMEKKLDGSITDIFNNSFLFLQTN
jgi:hypothetical protein